MYVLRCRVMAYPGVDKRSSSTCSPWDRGGKADASEGGCSRLHYHRRAAGSCVAVQSCGQLCSCSCSRSTLDGRFPLSEEQKPDVLEETPTTYRHSGTRRAGLGLRRESENHPFGLLCLQISLWKDRQKQPSLLHSDSG